MRNILKRALSLTLALVMVFGLLGLGAAPKVHADDPTPIIAHWGCGAEDPSYTYTFSSTADITSVTVTPGTISPTEVDPTLYRYDGPDAATKAVIASGGLTFTFEGNAYIPHTGEVAEITTSVFPASVSAKTVCVGQTVFANAYYNSQIGGAKLVFSVSNGNVVLTGSNESGYTAVGISAGTAYVTVKLVNASDDSKVYATRTDTINVYEPTVTGSSITLKPHNGDLFTLDTMPTNGLLATVTATGTYIDEAGLTLEATPPLAVSAPSYSDDKTKATWTVGVGSVSSNGEDEFAVALNQNGLVLNREEFKIDNQAPTGQFKVSFDGTNAVIDVSGVSGATNYKVNGNAEIPEGGKITVPAAVGDTLVLQAFDIHSNRFQANPTIYDVTVKDPNPVLGTENGSAVYYKAANKADMALPVEVSNGVGPVSGVIPRVDGCTMSDDHKNIIWGAATEGKIEKGLAGVTARYTHNGVEVTVPVTSALTFDQVLDVTEPTVTASAAKGIFYQTSSGYYLGVPSPNKQGTDTVTFVTEDNVLLATDIPEDDKTLTVSVSVTDSAVNRQDVAASSYTVIDAADNQSAGLILDGIDATKTAPVAKFTATPIVPAWASPLSPVDTDWHNEDINVSFTLNEGRDYTESDDGEPIPFANVEVTATFNGSDVAVSGSGYGAFTATLPVAGIESDAVTFDVTVKTTCDRVKEAMYTYLRQTYKVDVVAPAVNAVIDGTAKNTKFFVGDRTLTVTVADMAGFTGVLSYSRDGVAQPAVYFIASPFEFTFSNEGVYEITALTVTDDHGNWSKLDETLADPSDSRYASFSITGDAPKAFIIDKTAPTAEVMVTCSGTETKNPADGQLYFDDDVTVTIKMTDLYVDPAEASVAWNTTAPDSSKSGPNDTTDTDGYVTERKFSITLTDAAADEATLGEQITEITGKLLDMAGNPVTVITPAANMADFSITGGSFSNADTFIVDKHAPKVEFTLPTTPAYSYNGVDYYSPAGTDKVQVVATVTDINFDPVTTLVTLDLQGTDSVSKTWAELDGQADFEFTGDGNAVNTLTYTIEDGVRFNSIKVEAHDKATNQTTDETASNPIVVDTTKPTVDLSVTALDGEGASVIEYFYLNESNPDVIHVVLKDKNIQEAGKESSLTDEGQAVTVTINVTDLNISYNPAVEEARRLRNDPALTGVWSGTEQVNTETTLTYTDSFTVKKDEAGKLVVDVTVTDLLGQTPETVTVSTNTGGADNDDLSLHPTFTVVPGAGGEIKKIFSLDRERSSSTDDHKKPVVTLTNSVAPITTATSSGGQSVPLYNQGFSYTVKANDNIPLDDFGDPVNKFAGLRSIEWTVTDPKGAVTGGGKMPADSEAYPDDTYEATVTMPITVLADGSKETNDATLRVTVTDNAGNQVYFVKPFAVDTIDPRVTIAYSNNASVRNNEYYNADRTLTITVDDLFFAGGTLTVNGANTALNNGVNTYAFTGPDTDYVVSITVNDQVNHVTTGSEAGTTAQFTVTDGTTNPWKFTVDKVVPTINVTFNNNNAQNGHYYKDSRTATAMITERNFDAADAVYTATTGTSTLSAWTGANPHVATAVFDTDGDYAFTITFQDRAGNQAAPYTNPLFTIDLQDPEIEITGVEDYSANRGDLSPIVTFTDNNFKRDNDVATYSVKIEKVKGLDLSESEAVNLSSSTDEIENGVTLNYENLSKIRDNDGIYTLTATITDLSGRTVEKVVHYSLNRTGSTYRAVGDETIDLLKKVYSNKAPTVVIQEINPDELVSYNVTVSLNNGVAKLSEGTDFTAEKSGVQGSWKGVVYTINSSVFQSEGKLIEGSYTIVFDSEDKAGNLNSNRDNEVNVPVSFVLDETPPSLQINGIDEPRINADSIDATVLFQDGTAIARFEIYLNGELVRVIEGEELEQLSDSFIETIEKSNDWRVLRVKAIDVAGNESEIESIRFLVTTNALRLFVANPWLVGGAVALIAGGTTLGVVLGKKKKKDQDK